MARPSMWSVRRYQRGKLSRLFTYSIVLCTALNIALRAQEVPPPVTIDDLVERAQLPIICLSPDGRYVAYLQVKGLPLENEYEVEIGLLPTDKPATPVMLDHYHLAPELTFEPDSGNLNKSAGQLRWSPNSRELAYTSHGDGGMELRVRSIPAGSEKLLLAGFENIEIFSGSNALTIRAASDRPTEVEPKFEPDDLGLFMKDGYRFYGSLKNPKRNGKRIMFHGRYVWGAQSLVIQADHPSYLPSPEEWHLANSDLQISVKSTSGATTVSQAGVLSPDGNNLAVIEMAENDVVHSLLPRKTSQIVLRPAKGKGGTKRVIVPPIGSSVVYTLIGWSPDSRELYYLSVGAESSSVNAVDQEAHIREVHREKAGLVVPDPTSAMSDESAELVAVRSTNVTPDELVKIDLKTGEATSLYFPNRQFLEKSLPAVRYIRIECCDAEFFGRLYLPSDYAKGTQYPLVFTSYLSTPGFYASVGDEIPILPLTAHGVAVFALNARDSNVRSRDGDFRTEIDRVLRPLRAMEWVRQRLSEEGIIDPEKCGLTGLSYGAEIAMYAYWRSKIFHAVSAASGSWEPENYVLGGLPYASFLDSRGFSLPENSSYAKWKELSAGLNARRDLPPLLVQSSDGEEYFGTVETWFRLRRAGAAIEWYEYPNEGHVKRSPSTKWWVYQRNLEWFLFWLKDELPNGPSHAEESMRWLQMRAQFEK